MLTLRSDAAEKLKEFAAEELQTPADKLACELKKNLPHANVVQGTGEDGVPYVGVCVNESWVLVEYREERFGIHPTVSVDDGRDTQPDRHMFTPVGAAAMVRMRLEDRI